MIGKIKVFPKIPERIKGLLVLANNMWWCWNSDGVWAFRKIDEELWREISYNPAKFLIMVSQKALDTYAKDPEYLKLYDDIMGRFNAYMENKETWFDKKYPQYKDKTIVYFSMEYGIHESLPIYSGGLGILAGDHAKSASDLGLPFVAIGLLYRQGYFRQKIDAYGNQVAEYEDHDFDAMSVLPVRKEDGKKLIIDVDLAGRTVYAKIWQVTVGHTKLYLMDTDTDLNTFEDRKITSQLYGGDKEMRITQEILLGMGGAKLLKALEIEPSVWHINEGHAVFLALERIKDKMREYGLDFYEAIQAIKSNTIFTTHTPVPAGNETFPLNLMDKYFRRYWESIGISRHQFLDLGLQVQDGYEIFGLTILALRVSNWHNGVSKLHGEVASEMWSNYLWPGVPVEENPIGHVTNGIHTLTWMSNTMKKLLDKYLEKDWQEKIPEKKVWEAVDKIPDKELWATHQELKEKMIGHIRRRVRDQYIRLQAPLHLIKSVDTLFQKDCLTIGFARRFATYKRATLLFRDLERLKRIMNMEGKPIQIIFSGKAHPADQPGQELIRMITKISNMPEFKGKIIVLENYGIHLSRYMVRGVDIWLNNPRKPKEASGTSGMKVPINGGLNLSILDGWWPESYDGTNGWAIDEMGVSYSSEEAQDDLDAECLYDILEYQILPKYYNRGNNAYSKEWVQMKKNSMRTVTPQFATDRMVQEYTDNMYIPAADRHEKFKDNNFSLAKELSEWRRKIFSNWNAIHLSEISEKRMKKTTKLTVGDSINVSIIVFLAGLSPEDILLEIYFERLDASDRRISAECIQMNIDKELGNGRYVYAADIKAFEGGDYRYNVRIIPRSEMLTHKHDLGLIKWFR